MLKLLFWSLVAANGALFAFQQGYLAKLIPDGREPARIAQQFNADKIKLIAPPKPATGPAPAGGAEAAPDLEPVLARARAQQEALSCTEIGDFDAAEAGRFETALAGLALGDKLSRRAVQAAASHMVFIPSLGSKEAADRKVSELRRLGITDSYIIQDATELRWGISLGVFKSEEAARAHLAALTQEGVRSARIVTHGLTSNRVAFQLRALDADAKAGLTRIISDFPRQQARACQPA